MGDQAADAWRHRDSSPSRCSAAWALGLGLALVCAGTAIVQWPVLSAQASCFDDDLYVNDNPLVRSPGWQSIGRFFSEWTHPSSVPGYPHPLTMTSLMVDVALGGRPDALGPFHRTNLLLHLGCSVVLVLLVYRLLGHAWIAAVVGLVFAVHPLTVESIAWIAQRKTLLATLFGWAALLLYPYRSGARRVLCYGGSALCYVLALMSKPTVLVLPVVIALLVLALRRDSREADGSRPPACDRRSAVLSLLPFLVVALLATALVVKTNMESAQEGAAHGSLSMRLLAACHQIGWHVWHVFAPLRLSPFYPRPAPLSLANGAVLLGVGVTAALVLAAVVCWRSQRLISVGIATWLVLLLPTTGIVPFGEFYTFDNYAYLPAVGAAWILAAVLVWVMRRGVVLRSAAIAALALVIGAEAFMTRTTLDAWRDTEPLFRRMIAFYPRAGLLYADLGREVADQGRIEEALDVYARGLAVDDSSPVLWCNYANALYRTGKLDAARRAYEEALQRREDFAFAHQRLARVLIEQHEFAAARRHLERAIEMQPHFVTALENLAYVLMQLGETDEAIGTWQRILTFAPELTIEHTNLAAACLSRGEHAAAIEQLEIVLRQNPDDVAAMNTLADLLTTAGDPALRDPVRAVDLARRACALTSWSAPAFLQTLARAYAATGRFERAAATAEHALGAATHQRNPDLQAQLQSDLAAYRAGKMPPASRPAAPAAPSSPPNPKPRQP